MIADALNWHGYSGYTKMTAPSSNFYSTDEDESRIIIVHKNLSQNCSAKNYESKQRIVNKNLLQNYSEDLDELCSTEEDKSECTITEKKDAGNEVTYDLPIFNIFNVFECRKKILMCHMKERT